MGDEVQSMSTEDLISNLVTCDYRGQAFKRCCLDELLLRKTHDEIKNFQEAEIAPVGDEMPIAQGVGIIYSGIGTQMKVNTNIHGDYVGCPVSFDIYERRK